MTFPRFRVVGFVGTRRIGGPEMERRVKARLAGVFAQLEQELVPGEQLAAVSALALGGDTLFAEVVAERKGMPHQVFLPQTEDEFFNLKDFEDDASLARARRRLDPASGNVVEVRVVSLLADRRERFSECGYEIVNECDVLVAVHPGDAAGKPGGTVETMKHAEGLGRRIFEITLQDDVPVREIAAPQAAEKRAGEEDEVFAWPLALDPAIDDRSLALLTALKNRASDVSGGEKRSFRWVAATAVWTHVAATTVAAVALAFDLHHEALKGAKLLLLLSGFSVPFYFHHFRARPERRWVTGRLVAELCRSVLAVRGLPGQLGYLRNFYLPEYRQLIRALNLVRLQSARTSTVGLKEFADRYVTERIGEPRDGQPPSRRTQIGYFTASAGSAAHWRHRFETGFYLFSFAALVCALVYLFLHVEHHSPWWEQALFWFVPVVFPTAAAAFAGWISIMDYDRRAERFRELVRYLEEQRERIRQAAAGGMLVRAVHRTEHALLQEVVEWHAKHSHARGH